MNPTDIADTPNPAAAPQPVTTYRISIFQSLTLADYRWLFIGSTAMYLAMNMQMICRGWLILRLTNDSPLALAMVMVAFAAPMAILSPVGGALADRASKKKLLLVCMSLNALMTCLLATLDMLGIVRYGHLLVIGVINGTLMAVNVPSRQSMISDIIPRDLLMNAISLSNSSMNLARIVGPALAGIMIIFIDTWGVFYLISLSYLLAALFMLFIKSAQPKKTRRSATLVSDIRNGFQYVMRSPALRGMMLVLFFPALFQFGVQSLLPVWAKEVLRVGSDGLGYLITTSGLGALIGSLFLASHSNIGRKGLALIVMNVIAGITIILLAFSGHFVSALPLLFFNGMVGAVGGSLNMTLIQTTADEKMRGRVLSISSMAFSLAPLGVAPMGGVAERFGTPTVFAASGFGLLAFIIIFLLLDRGFRKLR